jgi:hypothetical protein
LVVSENREFSFYEKISNNRGEIIIWDYFLQLLAIKRINRKRVMF